MNSATLDRFLEVHGYISVAEAELLYSEASKVPDTGLILELGSFLGKSSLLLDSASKADLHCVDTWDGNATDCNRAEYRNTYETWRSNVGPRPIAHKMSTHNFLVAWDNRLKFDFVFIDACHQYEVVKKDFELVLPLVQSGGRIAFHDIGNCAHPGPGKLWDETASKVLTQHSFAGMVAVGTKV